MYLWRQQPLQSITARLFYLKTLQKAGCLVCDGAGNTGKGPNTTISMLHSFWKTWSSVRKRFFSKVKTVLNRTKQLVFTIVKTRFFVFMEKKILILIRNFLWFYDSWSHKVSVKNTINYYDILYHGWIKKSH